MRMLLPETTRLELTDGHWIVVKKRLNAGEERRVFARSTKALLANGKIELDPEKAAVANVVEYLLDWSLKDPQGNPVVIRDQPSEVLVAALDLLDPDSSREINDAIRAHIDRVDEEIAHQKKAAGSKGHKATSESAA